MTKKTTKKEVAAPVAAPVDRINTTIGEAFIFKFQKTMDELAGQVAWFKAKKVDLFQKVAAEVIVDSDVGQADAARLYSEGKELLNTLEGARKVISGPFDKTASAINSLFRGAKVVMDQALLHIGHELSNFQTKKENLAAEKRRAEQAEFLAKAKAQVDQGAPMPVYQASAPAEAPAKKIQTEAGTVSFREDWVCEITDASQVDRKFCAPVQTLLNNAVKAGLREAAGCKIYLKKTPINRF